MNDMARFGGIFKIICTDKNGNIKWEEEMKNLVVNVGLQYMLDISFSAGSELSPFYVGLLAASPTVAAADTMASHAGWTEFTDIDEATRQEWVEVRSAQTLTNTASPATFTCDTNSSSVGGAFITSDNTLSGSAGTLICGAAFTTGNKAMDDDDVLNVTYTFTAADDGA